jgi:hypothetical protein
MRPFLLRWVCRQVHEEDFVFGVLAPWSLGVGFLNCQDSKAPGRQEIVSEQEKEKNL